MENRPIDQSALGANQTGSVNSPGASRPADEARKTSQAGDDAGTPAFRVLLDRLSESAQELRQQAAGLSKPEHLAGAVDSARESLNEALSLGDQLLEAWRAEQQTPNEDSEA